MELRDLFQILDIFLEAAEEFLAVAHHRQAAVRLLVHQVLYLILAAEAVVKILTLVEHQPAVLE